MIDIINHLEVSEAKWFYFLCFASTLIFLGHVIYEIRVMIRGYDEYSEEELGANDISNDSTVCACGNKHPLVAESGGRCGACWSQITGDYP